MANTVTAFIPEIWSRESLAILHGALVMARLVHTDFAQDLAQYGQTVNTRKPATFASADDVDSTGATDLTISDASATNVAVTLNKWKHKTFGITDLEATKSFLNLKQIFLEPAVLVIANAVETDLLSLYTDITPVLTSASAAAVRTAINNARTRLNKQKAPTPNRVLVLSDDDEGALTNLDILNKLNEAGAAEGARALREGTVGRFKGFDVYRSSNVISLGSPSNRYNLAFHKNCFALVSRLVSNATPGQTPGALQSVSVDQDTGISLRTTISYQPLKFKTVISNDFLYGTKTLDTNLAVVIRGNG